MSQDQAEQNIQMWKVKKLIKSLDSARGCVPSPYPFRP
jgi:peptide chain release factor subunit 1